MPVGDLGGDAAQQPPAFGLPGPSFGGGEVAVVILVQVSGPVVPGVRALDDPALGQHLGAAAGNVEERRLLLGIDPGADIAVAGMPPHLHDNAVLEANLSRAPA